MTPPEGLEIELRRADPDDGSAVADLFWVTRQAAVPAMPSPIHTRESVELFWAAAVESMEVWVACAPEIVGFIALSEEWLHSIYVRPTHQGAGVGAMLLDLAKVRRPDGFGLWVFTDNHAARAFYARHGLVEVEHTDGSGNEERTPDTRVHWHPDTGTRGSAATATPAR